MAQKAHSPSSPGLYMTVYCCLMVAINSCNLATQRPTANPSPSAKDYSIDTTNVPQDTVLVSDSRLSLDNGIYFLGNQKYSGILKDCYPTGTVKSYASIFQGMLHGRYKSFYENGNPFEVRLYKNNLSTGRHYGFWPEKGILKFDYTYYEEKREGQQKRWYRSGKPYIFAQYVDDHEDGLQQGWRENGKIYLNYVAKEGYAYGLQKAALCYSLRDQKIKLKP